jgi:hypothetical protein
MANNLTPLTISEIATFASRRGIAPSVAYTLPAIFEKVAEMAGQPVRAIISQATFSNKALGDYITKTANTVAAEVA